MRLVAVSVGTRGDVEPLVELGVEMIRRGHEFKVAAMERYRPLCEARGVPYVRLDGDADYFNKLMVTDYKTSGDFVHGYEAFYRSAPAIFDQISEAVRGQDAAFYGTCSFFVRSAADLYHVPCIRYFFSPFDRTNQYSLYTARRNSPLVGLGYLGEEPGMNIITMRLMNGWRREHGLRAWRMWDDYRVQDGRKVLTFYPVSPQLMTPDPGWGGHIHVTGYWWHPDETEQFCPNERLASFLAAGEKPVFVTFGPARSDELRELQRRVVQALAQTHIRAVVQANQLDDASGWPESLLPVGAVPYAWMFGQVSAVVHHGGNSTNGLGLRAGLPTLVLPLALDQYFYGRRDHELGCGPAPLYVRKRIPGVEEIERALTELVSGRYDAAAAEVGERIRQEDGCRTAVEAIERWASCRRLSE